MRFRIASLLTQYTGGKKYIEIKGVNTLKEALSELDRKYPGIKFRFINEQDEIRPHMNLFVNSTNITTLDYSLNDEDEIYVVQSLSGGSVYN